MTDALYDFITMGVDFLVSAAMLSAIIIMLKSATIISVYNADQQATADRVSYYKEYSLYDCTTELSAADVKSALMYYKNDIQILIEYEDDKYVYNDVTTGKIMQGDLAGIVTEFTDYDQFSDYISSDYLFNAWLYESYIPEGNLSNSSDSADSVISDSGYKGGVIVGIRFEREIPASPVGGV